MNINKNINGFTLIEIVVILMILSTIAYFSLPLLNISLRKEREGTTIEKIKKLESALLYYYEDMNQFPSDSENIEKDMLVLEENVENDPGWKGPYIYKEFEEKDYIKDGWRGYFKYTYVPSELHCEIRSRGEDGKFSTKDDIGKLISAVNIVREKISDTKNKLVLIDSIAEKYRGANGKYPDSINSLVPDYIGDSYLTDSWGNPYSVLNGNTFYSFGPNKEDEKGEGDDIK